MTVAEFLADERFFGKVARDNWNHPTVGASIRRMVLRRRVKCADGFSLSIQYSAGHYCNAREPFMGGENVSGAWPFPKPKTVEIGFPSRREPLLTEFAEEPKRPTKTVFAWVPVKVVDEVLSKHGGLTHVRSDDYSRWEPISAEQVAK